MTTHSNIHFTSRLSLLSKKDVALMSTIIGELSSHERNHMLPLLHKDPQAMKDWLLSGTQEFGVLQTSSHQRRLRRDECWRRISTGKTEFVDFDCSRYSFVRGLLKSFNPFRFSGYPSGSHYHMKISKVPPFDMGLLFPLSLFSIFLSFYIVLMTSYGDIVPPFYIDHKYRILSFLFFLIQFSCRCADVLIMGPTGRAYIGAQTMLPTWRLFQHRILSYLECKKNSQPHIIKQPSASDIEASILRVSLGQPLTQQEEYLLKCEQNHQEQIQRSLEEASDPASSLALRESHHLEQLFLGTQTPKRTKKSRL